MTKIKTQLQIQSKEKGGWPKIAQYIDCKCHFCKQSNRFVIPPEIIDYKSAYKEMERECKETLQTLGQYINENKELRDKIHEISKILNLGLIGLVDDR